MSAAPEPARFSLDTNVLVYAVDVEAGPRHERARRILGSALGRPCVLALQSPGEF
jgi:predicted nucleic acid-binding protein